MMFDNKRMLFIFLYILLGGCSNYPGYYSSEEQSISNVETPFENAAINVDILADPDLNYLNGSANSCTLLVVQSNKQRTLQDLFRNPSLIKAIFNYMGAQNDILKIDRYSVMPGQNATLHIDRSQGTRFLAVVVGYYPFPQKQHMLLFPIPSESVSNGFFRFKSWHSKLISFSFKLRLGNSGISNIEGVNTIKFMMENETTPSGPEIKDKDK